MFHDFSYINGVLWVVVGVIMLVGNVTYADYYTKLNKKFLEYFWCTYLICIGVSFVNFMMVLVAKTLMNTTNELSPINYGLGWLYIMSLCIYSMFLIYSICFGFANLKQYFGRKRNKI